MTAQRNAIAPTVESIPARRFVPQQYMSATALSPSVRKKLLSALRSETASGAGSALLRTEMERRKGSARIDSARQHVHGGTDGPWWAQGGTDQRSTSCSTRSALASIWVRTSAASSGSASMSSCCARLSRTLPATGSNGRPRCSYRRKPANEQDPSFDRGPGWLARPFRARAGPVVGRAGAGAAGHPVGQRRYPWAVPMSSVSSSANRSRNCRPALPSSPLRASRWTSPAPATPPGAA